MGPSSNAVTRAFLAVALASASATAQAQEANYPIRYAQTDTPLLAEARVGGPSIDTISCGSPVTVVEAAIRAPFLRVVSNGRLGYAAVANIGSEQRPQCESPLAAEEVQEAARRALVTALLAEAMRKTQSVGACRCPGDLAADNSRCGERSAFSRLGGADPRDCV